jgi:hypothetical protein
MSSPPTIFELCQGFAASSPFWQTYTSEETWLPLILPTIFWTSMWAHRRFIVKKSFAKFNNLHDFHHIVAMVMGLTSMYVNDNTLFNERIVILWSSGYFVMDALDCILLKDYIYIFHGVLSLVFGILNYNVPLLRELRMNSKAVMMEISSIPLHRAQQTKDPIVGK